MIRALIERIGNEPILLVSLAIEGLKAFEASVNGGFGPEDAATAAAIAALGFLGRQLVVPARKVASGEVALKPVYVEEENPPAPVFDDEDPA